MDFSCLIPTHFAQTVHEWLREDLHGFDYVGAVVGNNPQQATLFAKSGAVMCGKPFFNMVMKEVGCEVEWLVDEGQFLPGSNTNRIAAAHVTGLARHIMLGERLALNIIGQASGIATRCRKLAQLAQEEDFAGSIAATRKVTPGFRVVQKYAVIVGGCDSHRMDLGSMVMLKDNAIEECGSITAAVRRASAVAGFSLKIEVECRTEAEAMEAVATSADILMLDNFPAPQVHPLAEKLKRVRPTVLVEVSGGITDDTITQYMGPNIDVISSSSLILGVASADFSLKILNSQPSTPVL